MRHAPLHSIDCAWQVNFAGEHYSPEQELCRAVLMHALRSAAKANNRDRWWLLQSDSFNPFSCLWILQALNLDAERFRQGLRSMLSNGALQSVSNRRGRLRSYQRKRKSV